MNGTVAALMLAVTTVMTRADTNEPPPGVLEEASSRFTAAVEAFAKKDYEAAAQGFAGANALVSHPNTMINLALALEQLGDLTGAWWVLRRASERFADEPRPLDLAKQELQSLASRTFLVQLQAPPGAEVCVDDVRIPEESAGTFRVALPPGAHTVRVGDVQVTLTGEAGTERVLGFERIEDFLIPPQRRHVTNMAATTGGLAALSAGLGLGALAAGDAKPSRLALGYSAAAVGLAATGTAIALAIRTRNPERRAGRQTPEAEADSCAPFIDPEAAGAPTGLQRKQGPSIEPADP